MLPSVVARAGQHASPIARGGDGRLPDRVAPGLQVLFVGINPGMRSAALGHHFAGHSNRFWKLLRDVGLVPETMGYERDAELPRFGLGLTNLVERATPGVADLGPDDFVAGRERLLEVIRDVRPRIVALVGITVYRRLFDRRGTVRLGMQEDVIDGTRVFVLPNPSGRNAHHSYAAMREAFGALRALVACGRASGGAVSRAERRGRSKGVARGRAAR